MKKKCSCETLNKYVPEEDRDTKCPCCGVMTTLIDVLIYLEKHDEVRRMYENFELFG